MSIYTMIFALRNIERMKESASCESQVKYFVIRVIADCKASAVFNCSPSKYQYVADRRRLECLDVYLQSVVGTVHIAW
jgi:hypothetical protein